MSKISREVRPKENAYIIPFLSYWFNRKIVSADFVKIPENGGSYNTPDYYLPKVNYLVEIKEIRDRKDTERHAQWNSIVNKLQKAIDSNANLKKIKGSYLVDTPDSFKSQTDSKYFIEASNLIIDSVVKNEKTVKVFGVNFEINKVGDGSNYIVFGTSSGGSFSASQTIFENIHLKIETADKQLGYKFNGKVQDKKIILLVNKYQLLFWDWDLFKAMSYMYDNLLSLENVDEIWFQNETKSAGIVHKLLYKKSFFEGFEQMQIKCIDQSDYDLFSNWFSSLSEINDDKKNKLVDALKKLLSDKNPEDIFKNPLARIEMVRLGKWLIENKRYDDANWLITKFIKDPDPEISDSTLSDDNVSLHDKIIKEKDPRSSMAILTVMGHLAWTVQSLTLQKETIVNSFEYTKSVLEKTKNLYVVSQWLVPLIELCNRRFWLKEVSEKDYRELKKLCFWILRQYSKYPALSREIVRVFYFFKNLSTSETVEVLETLDNAEDSETLLIYFALYRNQHFKGSDYPDEIANYNYKPALGLLINKIKDDSEVSKDVKSGIAWNLWKILSENETEFDRLSPYIDLFATQPYNKNLSHNIERIIEDFIERKPEMCFGWFSKLIQSIKSYILSKPEMAREVWITADIDIVLNTIASHFPKNLYHTVSELVEIWKSGAYVGSPKEILLSYRSVSETSLRGKLLIEFNNLYIEMKRLNSKIELVVFD